MASFADGFVRLVNRDFFKANFDYPIRVLVFENQAQFQKFQVEQLHIAGPAHFGIYVSEHKFFATFEDSGLGTFAHEILHPLVERNLKDRPQWAMEGIPSFFEKFYGYWRNGELTVDWGYQNPWRIEQLGTNLMQLDLKQIISDSPTNSFSQIEQSESSSRMVSVFLWQHGRFQRFLNLIATRDKAGYPTYFEAAMELPIEKILPLWREYLSGVASDKSRTQFLPLSSIFLDEKSFLSFMKVFDVSQDQPVKRN